MKKFLILLLSTFWFQVLPVANAGEMIAVNAEVRGYLALPADKGIGVYPGVLLIHEWWGLNDQIKGIADQFAEKGFVALAVDLYHGTVTTEPGLAYELMHGLTDEQALMDMQVALNFLERHQAVHEKKMGVIGWSMGGSYALKLALEDSRIQAVTTYYGRLIMDKKKLKNLRAPFLGIFGALDRGISPESIRDFEFRLKQMLKRVEIHIYPHAGHSFATPNHLNEYHAAAAQDAWAKTLIFFKGNLA